MGFSPAAVALPVLLALLALPWSSASANAIVTVIVNWRESISITVPVLEEILKNQLVPADLIYIHLDFEFFRDVLKEAQKLQVKYPDRMQIVTTSSWDNRHELFNRVLPTVKTQYVAFHDNNNQGLPEDWLKKMLETFETTEPRPVIVAPKINAVEVQAMDKPADHHAVMKVTIMRKHRASGRGDHQTPVLIWRGDDGTKLKNSKNLDVRAGDAVETHSWVVDLSRLKNRTALLDERCAFASYHIELGLRLYKEFGYGSSAVVTGLEYSYMYPNTHMQLADVPLTVVRWNAWDSMSSIRFLEQKYDVLYHHQHGWDWHNRAAFYDVLFYKENEEALTEDPMLTMALTVSMYALQHVTHFTVIECSVPDATQPNRYTVHEETPQMTVRQTLQWISDNAAKIRHSFSPKQAQSGQIESAPMHYRVGIAQKTFDLKAHTRQKTGAVPLSKNNETKTWIRETFSDESTVPWDEIKDGSRIYAEYVAKKNDINSALYKVGFVWFQGRFTKAMHKDLTQRSMIVLYSAPLQVYRYLIFVPKQIEKTGLDKEMISLLYSKHSAAAAHTLPSGATSSSVEMTLYFRGYPSRGKKIFIYTNTSNDSGVSLKAKRLAPRSVSMDGSIDALTPTFKLVRWGCKLNETNAYRNYAQRKNGKGTNMFSQEVLKELFAN